MASLGTCILILTGYKFSSVLFITAQVDIKNYPKNTIVTYTMSCIVVLLLVHVMNLSSYHNNITIIVIIDSAVTVIYIYIYIYNCVVIIHDMLRYCL